MHLPDMPKRLVPFPLVLVAVTGAFILVALYADVRGRERRAADTAPVNAPVVVADPDQPDVSATTTESDTVAETPAPQPLGLPPEVPTSDVPAAAVFDCWRYEWRGDRLIVDRDYRHIAGDGIEPMVGPDTAHLRCRAPQYALRSDDGSITVFWGGAEGRAQGEQGRPASLARNTLFRVDALTGEVASMTTLEGLDPMTDYALIAFSPDQSAVWLRADSSKNRVTTLYRVAIEGDVRTYAYPNMWSPLELTPDQSRAVGFEYTQGLEFESDPVYLHRVNLATGARVRTKPLTGVMGRMIPEHNWRPVFIDDERLIMPGSFLDSPIANGAVVVNAFTGATARVPQLTGTVELFALTQDGSTLYAFSDQMPLTAIPVAELPKP